jgi:predicted ATPase
MNVWKCVGNPAAPPADDPEEAGALIGRERESAALRGLLAEHHLVSVTGRTGVGKSRLAAETVHGIAPGTRGPWRRTVRVRRRGNAPGAPGALAADVYRALTGRRPRRGDAGVPDLAAHLPAAGVLLFLDDVDPVHEECVGLVQRLLVAVPGLRVLVTARQALGLGEEAVLPLTPLDTEGAGGRGPAPAVELFLDRARGAARGFDAADLRAVEGVCRRLEGVPLAIELAADQLALGRQSLHDLVESVERGQCRLHSERPALRRHRSLRDAIGACYALCDREARIVWGRASAFAGAFNESAAVFLCTGGAVASERVPSLLVRLAAVGALETVRPPGGLRQPRYRMTRAAREFGAERLREAGETEVALERRAAHCRQVASVAEVLWAAGCQAQAVGLVHEEREELSAILRQAVNRPDHAEAALETVLGLWFWWAVYDRADEGRGHLLRLLPRCPADSPAGRRGRWLAAWLSASRDPRAARTLAGRAWPEAVLSGDDVTVGQLAHVQGLISLHEGEPRAAAEHFREAARTVPDRPLSGPPPAVSLAAQAVAEAAFAPAAARRTARRALAQRSITDDDWAMLAARYAQALADHHSGHSGRAWRRARRALAGLDPTLPEPGAAQALRALADGIETGIGDRPRPPQPMPLTGLLRALSAEAHPTMIP